MVLKNDSHTELSYGICALEKDCVTPKLLRYFMNVLEI